MKLRLALVFLVWSHPVSAATFSEQVSRHFAAWDVDQNAALSVPEMDHAIASRDFTGEVAAAVVALKRGVKDKSATLSLEAIMTQVAKSKTDPKALPNYDKLHAWAVDRIVTANRALFATLPPQVDSIRQGKLGDCFCLAALRTLIQRDPQAVVQMIRQDSNGVYEVRMGGTFINVPPLTDGEIAIGASAGNGLWPLVYEKAVGISRTPPGTPSATPLSVVSKGGSAGSMMSTLTSHPIKRWSCESWRNASPEQKPILLGDLRRQFQTAFAERRLVTGGTAAPPKDKSRPSGILFNHGYAVLGYDKARDEVHLWNPHGAKFTPKGMPGLVHGYPMDKGEFRVPLEELVTFFGGFAFEQTDVVPVK